MVGSEWPDEPPALLVVQDQEFAARFATTLQSFGRRVALLEGEVTTPWEGVGPEPEVVAARYALRNQPKRSASPDFIIMTSELAQQRWMSDASFSKLCFELCVDDEIEPSHLGSDSLIVDSYGSTVLKSLERLLSAGASSSALFRGSDTQLGLISLVTKSNLFSNFRLKPWLPVVISNVYPFFQSET